MKNDVMMELSHLFKKYKKSLELLWDHQWFEVKFLIHFHNIDCVDISNLTILPTSNDKQVSKKMENNMTNFRDPKEQAQINYISRIILEDQILPALHDLRCVRDGAYITAEKIYDFLINEDEEVSDE